MNSKTIFHLIILIGILSSCKSRYRIQPYSLSRNIQICDTCNQRKVWSSSPKKSIVLVSDSTLNYTRIFGGIGATTKIKYKRLKDTLILNQIDIYGRKVRDNFQNFSNLYLINNDSLTSLQNNEKYYSDSYTKTKIKEFEPFYLIVNNQKIKLDNRRKAIRKLKKLVGQEKEWTELDKEVAKSEYGIATKYRTYKINE